MCDRRTTRVIVQSGQQCIVGAKSPAVLPDRLDKDREMLLDWTGTSSGTGDSVTEVIGSSESWGVICGSPAISVSCEIMLSRV